jgi:hypothetical protein
MSHSDERDEVDELDDDDVPTVEIPGFVWEEVKDKDTLFETHPLIELLTPPAKIKIILTLMGIHGEKLPPSDIYNRARISHDTWYKHKDILIEKYDVIEQAGNAGNSPLYRINAESELVTLIDAMIGVAGDQKEEWLIEHRRD